MAEPKITFALKKLVRDKLPETMVAVGQEPEVTQLHGEELKAALIAKVAEELAELDPASPSYTSELADVLQALEDLLSISDEQAVRALQAEHFAKRGGFAGGYYIATLALKASDRWVEYYRSNPQKYPES